MPAKKRTAKKAAPKRKVAKKAAPKRKVAKKAAPKRKVAKKTAKKKVAKKKVAKKKVAKKKTAKKPAKKKVAKKAAPKKRAVKKVRAKRAGQREPAHDQRRRQPRRGVRWQASGVDVRDDEARRQASELNHSRRRRFFVRVDVLNPAYGPGLPFFQEHHREDPLSSRGPRAVSHTTSS
jgi:hypothetical protein